MTSSLRCGRGASPTRVVDVLVPLALDRCYSYRAPAGLDLAPGDLVSVPLGTRETLGIVWDADPMRRWARLQPEGRERQA